MAEDVDTSAIEGLDADLRASGKPSRWEQFRLPVELGGKSFLDVGCWEGVHCADAVRRGADDVVGIDLATSDDLAANVDRYRFEFLQLDVLGERWLELGEFDIALCAALLSHVESPLGLLLRLRRVVRELLVIETGITRLEPERPLMLYHGTEGGNPSYWWTPNSAALESMLRTAGFDGVATVWEEDRQEGFARVCVHAVPRRHPDRARLLPRKARQMSLHGGNRGRRRDAEPSGEHPAE